MPCLEQLGFHLVGYGCTTCIGNKRATARAGRRGRAAGRSWVVAAVLKRQPQLRRPRQPVGSGRTIWPPRRWWWRTRWPAPSISIPRVRTAWRRPFRQGGFLARHLAFAREEVREVGRKIRSRRDVPQGVLRRFSKAAAEWNSIRRSPAGDIYEWSGQSHTSSARPISIRRCADLRPRFPDSPRPARPLALFFSSPGHYRPHFSRRIDRRR